MASTDPNIDLINNGIQTIEFIQSNRDEIQKTYGRSSIGQPRTKERTAAWEAYLESKDGNPEGYRRGGESQDGDPQSSSKESNTDNGWLDTKSSLSDNAENGPTNSGDNKRGNDEDFAELNSRAGENSGRESDGTSGRGSSISTGTTGTEGSHPIDKIDDGDYDGICLLDQATEDHLLGKETPGKLEVREAKPSDIAEILSEDSSRTHRRLRGIRSISQDSSTDEGDQSPVKKGHRREYCIDVFEGKTYIREWCNPSCTPITINPYKQECQCRRCPRVCPDCQRD
ncbi:V protein [Meliandou lophuromys virus]|uniref:Non-structural protein V n=1 Tax=Meliandou lophuromys virus TaxID=2940986 RepID=A0AAE9HTA8_9MONO|nr:V protein [Meliandou lophuromys virus]